MSQPGTPQPYQEPERRPDPEATYSPKPYMPPVQQPAHPPYVPPPVQQPYQPYAPPQPYYVQYPVRPPYKSNSVWAHVGLFLFTGGIGNVIYALWVHDQNKRNGY